MSFLHTYLFERCLILNVLGDVEQDVPSESTGGNSHPGTVDSVDASEDLGTSSVTLNVASDRQIPIAANELPANPSGSMSLPPPRASDDLPASEMTSPTLLQQRRSRTVSEIPSSPTTTKNATVPKDLASSHTQASKRKRAASPSRSVSGVNDSPSIAGRRGSRARIAP